MQLGALLVQLLLSELLLLPELPHALQFPGRGYSQLLPGARWQGGGARSGGRALDHPVALVASYSSWKPPKKQPSAAVRGDAAATAGCCHVGVGYPHAALKTACIEIHSLSYTRLAIQLC
jgi:hypothetical protein